MVSNVISAHILLLSFVLDPPPNGSRLHPRSVVILASRPASIVHVVCCMIVCSRLLKQNDMPTEAFPLDAPGVPFGDPLRFLSTPRKGDQLGSMTIPEPPLVPSTCYLSPQRPNCVGYQKHNKTVPSTPDEQPRARRRLTQSRNGKKYG